MEYNISTDIDDKFSSSYIAINFSPLVVIIINCYTSLKTRCISIKMATYITSIKMLPMETIYLCYGHWSSSTPLEENHMFKFYQAISFTHV